MLEEPAEGGGAYDGPGSSPGAVLGGAGARGASRSFGSSIRERILVSRT
jgi:hypothetical protein